MSDEEIDWDAIEAHSWRSSPFLIRKPRDGVPFRHFFPEAKIDARFLWYDKLAQTDFLLLDRELPDVLDVASVFSFAQDRDAETIQLLLDSQFPLRLNAVHDKVRTFRKVSFGLFYEEEFSGIGSSISTKELLPHIDNLLLVALTTGLDKPSIECKTLDFYANECLFMGHSLHDLLFPSGPSELPSELPCPKNPEAMILYRNCLRQQLKFYGVTYISEKKEIVFDTDLATTKLTVSLVKNIADCLGDRYRGFVRALFALVSVNSGGRTQKKCSESKLVQDLQRLCPEFAAFEMSKLASEMSQTLWLKMMVLLLLYDILPTFDMKPFRYAAHLVLDNKKPLLPSEPLDLVSENAGGKTVVTFEVEKESLGYLSRFDSPSIHRGVVVFDAGKAYYHEPTHSPITRDLVEHALRKLLPDEVELINASPQGSFDDDITGIPFLVLLGTQAPRVEKAIGINRQLARDIELDLRGSVRLWLRNYRDVILDKMLTQS
jgi:hypothetical protein